jgi:hypothetical protein
VPLSSGSDGLHPGIELLTGDLDPPGDIHISICGSIQRHSKFQAGGFIKSKQRLARPKARQNFRARLAWMDMNGKDRLSGTGIYHKCMGIQ